MNLDKLWGKRLAALALALTMAVFCLPAALAADLNVDAGFYMKQSQGGTCTLTSAAMMLRRRAYLDGLEDWCDVTENSVRPAAWADGLSHSFTYKEMRVSYDTLPSALDEKTQTLIELLEEHPEGIVLYDRSQPHAVLLTDYTDGVFYCADPAGYITSGRVPISSASVSIARASCYWYISQDNNALTAQTDVLRLEGMLYPENVHTGSAMRLGGTACSGTGASLTYVEIAILDAAGQTVQCASAALDAGTTLWSFRELDNDIRFGQLAPGGYTYMVVVEDSTGQTLYFASEFLVSDAAACSASYWSAQDTAGEKLQPAEEQPQTGQQSSGSWLGDWLRALLSF